MEKLNLKKKIKQRLMIVASRKFLSSFLIDLLTVMLIALCLYAYSTAMFSSAANLTNLGSADDLQAILLGDDLVQITQLQLVIKSLFFSIALGGVITLLISIIAIAYSRKLIWHSLNSKGDQFIGIMNLKQWKNWKKYCLSVPIFSTITLIILLFFALIKSILLTLVQGILNLPIDEQTISIIYELANIFIVFLILPLVFFMYSHFSKTKLIWQTVGELGPIVVKYWKKIIISSLIFTFLLFFVNALVTIILFNLSIGDSIFHYVLLIATVLFFISYSRLYFHQIINH